MDERVSVVFSWDPRAQAWVKERGPEDAVPPPVAPIDDRAVQTYFLDPQNGRWTSTILGPRARVVAGSFKEGYRSAAVPGLAYPDLGKKPQSEEKRGAPIGLMAGIATLVLMLGGGGFVASQMLAGTAGLPAAAATAAPARTAPPTVAPTPEPSTPAPVVATPRPPQTVRYSVRTPNGTQIVYSGPDVVAQGGSLRGVISVVLAPATGGYQSLTVYFGDPNVAMTSAFVQPDANGNVSVVLSAAVPRGAQPLRVQYGQTPGVFTLGTVTVR